MVLLSALAAFSAISFQGGTLTLAGKVVQITYPPTPVRQIPEEVKNWDGFQGLAPNQREWPTPFSEAGDWSAIQTKIGNLGTPTKGGPEWKTKVFILTQSDILIGGSGPLQQVRNRLDQKQIDTVLRSLARTPGYIRAATDGAVNPSLDVTVEQDPLVLSSGDPNFADYLKARVNRGRFDAEDKVFRGPFSAVIVLTVEQIQAALSRSADGYGIEEIVAKAIARQAFTDRWMNLEIPVPIRSGQAGEYAPQIQTLFPNEIWAILQGSDDTTYDSLVKLYGLAAKVQEPREQYTEFPWRAAPISANVEVGVATDDQRGSVLKYGERSPARFGGFALPYQNIDLAKTPHLTFWAKTTSKDAIALCINDGSTKGGLGWFQPLSIPSNGTWTQVTVNLAKRKRDVAHGIYIVPSPGSRDRQQIGEIAFLLDDFRLTGEGQPNQPDQLPDPEIFERALAAKKLSASELGKDTSDIVKLNGLVGHEGPYPASDEAALTELTKNVNVRIAGEATKRLAELGTPTAKAEILRLVTASPFEHVKQIAAIEVGKFRDPKSAGILSRLFASKSWQSRLAGAQALTMLPGDEAAVISMTFLQETDPQVRLAVTQGANAQNNVVVKRLLWSTVNDPSDAVRAESAWKLISSGRPKDAAEGYKAIRDDSIGVRMSLLGRFEASPNEAHRPAIRLAIADISPWVRAKALRTLAKQPGEVSNEEVANTFDDKFPVVQMALLDLAKSKGLTLPASAVASLKSSIDPRVVERAKDLLP